MRALRTLVLRAQKHEATRVVSLTCWTATQMWSWAVLKGHYAESVIGTSGQTTLHRVVECYRIPGEHYENFAIMGPELPEPREFHGGPPRLGSSGSRIPFRKMARWSRDIFVYG